MQCDNVVKKLTVFSHLARNREFYNGKQWATSSNKADSIVPKPVFNICKLFVNSKVSNIVSTPISLRYLSSDSTNATDEVSNFSKYMLKEMNHDTNRELLTKKSSIDGGAFAHYYYNEAKMGTLGDYEGGMEEEIVGIDNVRLANPKQDDIEKQKYIIIRSRKSVLSLRNKCENKEDAKRIVPDNVDWEESKGLTDNDMCYTYLKYFKHNGEVYHQLATETVEIYSPKPLNPNLVKVKLPKVKVNIDLESALQDDKLEYESDNEPMNSPDSDLVREVPSNKFYLYPLTKLNLEYTDESAYGISEIEDIVPTQKFINQLYSMQLYSIMQNAWDKYVVNKGALGNQIINNQPGQVLVDYTPGGNGIKRLGGMNAMSNGVADMAGNVFNFTRTVKQINEVFTGETASKDLSGTAIAQLQAQNDKPTDAQRNKLWKCEEKMGRILELFYKFYFTEKKYSYERTEAEIYRNKVINRALPEGKNPLPTERYNEAIFNGEKYLNTTFNIVVEAVQGTKDSDIMMMSIIQTLFLNGAWNNMDIHGKKMFVEMYPLPEKDKFKALVEANEQDVVSQLQATIEQQQQIIAKLQQTLQQATGSIDFMKNVNVSLQKQLKDTVSNNQKELANRDEAMRNVLEQQASGSQTLKE